MAIKDFGFLAEGGDLIVVAARSKKDAADIIKRDYNIIANASEIFVF